MGEEEKEQEGGGHFAIRMWGMLDQQDRIISKLEMSIAERDGLIAERDELIAHRSVDRRSTSISAALNGVSSHNAANEHLGPIERAESGSPRASVCVNWTAPSSGQ
jgi:hypothetical protein